MPAATIDEVIEQLDGVIGRAHREASRDGYFAALYRKVTVAVKQGIAEGLFEDGERMERLDVVFANRYLEAVATAARGGEPTRSWAVAFRAARSWWPIVLQHLLLGINAHINLDLGIAAARTSPGAGLPGLRRDFEVINRVLAGLVVDVRRELTEVWPRLARLERLSRGREEVIINFSLAEARDHAWRLAERLAPLTLDQQEDEIAAADHWVAKLGRLVWRPGPVARLTTAYIRLGERGTVPEIIDRLR